MGVTEFATFRLKAGINAQDPSDPANRLLKETVSIVASAPGAHRILYGTENEDPTHLQFFVDWDKVEDHINFTKSPAYGPMLANLTPLMDAAPVVRHTSPKPFPSSQLRQFDGALEVFTAYLPSDVSQSAQDSYEEKVKKFMDIGLGPGPDFLGFSSGGFSLENDVESLKGKPGKLYVGFIAWKSIDGHLKWRENAAFKDNVHLLAEDAESICMFHIHPEEYKAGLS